VHGGENDVLWLQRDFHLYLVNVHDTQKLAAAAGFHRMSLSHLLQEVCGVQVDKSYQVSPCTHWDRLAPHPSRARGQN
jgi:cation-transporting P-type ATPase D